MKLIKEIYDYREMIFSLVRRDIKSRYQGSILGVLWMFMDPLLQLGVYTLVFSTILENGIDKYYLFLFVTLVPWNFFSTCISGGTGVILGQQDMVKKIYFPREILPIAFATSQFVNMLLCFIAVFFVVIISGVGISIRALLFLPLIMIIEYFMALGITLITSGMTVYFRDMQHIMGVLSLLWMFLTPVMYSLDSMPENLRFLFNFNPMTSVILAYRDILYNSKIPDLKILVLAVGFGIVVMIIGLIMFRNAKKHFAEEL